MKIPEYFKKYNPEEFEFSIYEEWERNGYFSFNLDTSKPKFSLAMPPPNVTGQLHMGHALDNTLQDIIIRWKRMQGYNTLWLPGMDHASIATEAKLVEKLRSKGKTKLDVGRDAFIEMAWEWTNLHGGKILHQLRKLGCSCDWNKERFTYDEHFREAVVIVFKKLYDDGLIYRGKKVVNWCPTCNTSISDEEVDYEEQNSFLWHIRYPVVGENENIIIATTRPETMLGDTAIAVNPKDIRYINLIGKTVILPILNKEIPIIGDNCIEIDFGTGAVKVTPSHDFNDFEIGLRHNLPQIVVMNSDATMNENAGIFAGLAREVARKEVVMFLQKNGFIEKIEPYQHNVGVCYRCNTAIEPMLSNQWFVKMKDLAAPAIDCVTNGQIKFIPEKFEKTYFNWMNNIRDWCISRQLWWGHRIPAYYCNDCNNICVEIIAPIVCSICGSKNIAQDEDTLDTWFSSALWPFVTMNWPMQTALFEKFYPTDVLVTGYDIIFFWVARMIFSSIKHIGKPPFDAVLIHGIVRDNLGRKMSKSLGNGIDPLEIIEKFGADALRLSLVLGTANGTDIKYADEKIEASRNFANKIWNASKFVLMNIEIDTLSEIDVTLLSIADKWILSRLNTTIKNITQYLERYELGLAAKEIYDFFWDEFCDWYIEISKPIINLETNSSTVVKSVLKVILETSLKLLHVFMPFITTKIYRMIFPNTKELMLSDWPIQNTVWLFPDEEVEFAKIVEIIKAIRAIRVEKNVPMNMRPKVFVVCDNETLRYFFIEQTESINRLSKSEITVINSNHVQRSSNDVVVPFIHSEIIIPLGELIDIETEKARVIIELKKAEEEVLRLSKKLNNPDFIEKAPQKIIDGERAKKAMNEELILKFSRILDSFNENNT